jgi:hypothetical protein
MDASDPPVALVSLPIELVHCICDFLTTRHMLMLSATCTDMRDAIRSEFFWRNFCRTRWPAFPAIAASSSSSSGGILGGKRATRGVRVSDAHKLLLLDENGCDQSWASAARQRRPIFPHTLAFT